MKNIAFALLALISVPTFVQAEDYGFKSQNGSEETHARPSDQVQFTRAPKAKQPTANGIDPVEGAIVCPSLNETMWLLNRISQARMSRTYMPAQNRKMVILQDGYDPWEEPNPSDYRCQLVPAGTPMEVKLDSGIPIVHGEMKDGRPFAGVTSPAMIDH